MAVVQLKRKHRAKSCHLRPGDFMTPKALKSRVTDLTYGFVLGEELRYSGGVLRLSLDPQAERLQAALQ